MAAGYSGRIISFSTESTGRRAVDDKYGRSVQMVNDEVRIKTLKTEIEQLKAKVDKEKEKMKKMSTVVADYVNNSVQDFSVNHKLILDTNSSLYILSIELQVPIDLVLIKSPVVLEIVDAGK